MERHIGFVFSQLYACCCAFTFHLHLHHIPSTSHGTCYTLTSDDTQDSESVLPSVECNGSSGQGVEQGSSGRVEMGSSGVCADGGSGGGQASSNDRPPSDSHPGSSFRFPPFACRGIAFQRIADHHVIKLIMVLDLCCICDPGCISAIVLVPAPPRMKCV